MALIDPSSSEQTVTVQRDLLGVHLSGLYYATARRTRVVDQASDRPHMHSISVLRLPSDHCGYKSRVLFRLGGFSGMLHYAHRTTTTFHRTPSVKTTWLQGRSVAEGGNSTSRIYCIKDKFFTIKMLICCPNNLVHHTLLGIQKYLSI
jgi:hypothetical protein